jgi:hypothetical protein
MLRMADSCSAELNEITSREDVGQLGDRGSDGERKFNEVVTGQNGSSTCG